LTRDASPRLGSLFIALSTVLFGSLGVATKGIFQLAKTNALSVTLVRAAIALPALAAMCAVVQGRRMFRIAAGDLRLMAVAGLMMALYQAAFVVAITHASVTLVTLVTVCSVPVCAAAMSTAMLGERVPASVLVALGLAVAGVGLLVGADTLTGAGAASWLGVAFGLLSAVSYTLFQICGRVLASRYHPLQTLSVFLLVAVLALLPITAMNGLVATYPPAAWLLFLYLGLGVSVLGYVCLVLGLRTMPVTRATIVSLLEPLTGVSLAWVLFGERLGISGVLGGALLLIAMGIVFRGAAARPPGAPRPARAPLA
jgi:DME family drug/metabolite transporter